MYHYNLFDSGDYYVTLEWYLMHELQFTKAEWLEHVNTAVAELSITGRHHETSAIADYLCKWHGFKPLEVLYATEVGDGIVKETTDFTEEGSHG